MANYYDGLITLTGDWNTLRAISDSLDRLEDIILEHGVEADETWLPGILQPEILDGQTPAIFHDGTTFDTDKCELRVQYHSLNDSGHDFWADFCGRTHLHGVLVYSDEASEDTAKVHITPMGGTPDLDALLRPIPEFDGED